MDTIIKRMHKTTPKYFKKIRNAGLAIVAIGASIPAAPVVLPAILLQIAGYLVLAGGVLTIFLVRIHSGDILGTAILAAAGAVVSFFISCLLKYFMTRRRR